MKIRVCLCGLLTAMLGQHRRRRPRLFAIEYFNENIGPTSITPVFKLLFGNVLLLNPGVFR